MEKLPMNETTENAEVIETEATEAQPVETTDLNAEVEKWKSLSRKNEQQAKANAQAAKELEELKKSQLSDTEKLIESAKAETAKQLKTEFATKLVDSELKAALNGRVLDGGSLLEFNKNSFITDEGDVDTDAIQSWVEAHSKSASLPAPDLGQGSRGTNPSRSLVTSRDELASMTSDEILTARKEGRLDKLMGKI
jgi:hypothetical protein